MGKEGEGSICDKVTKGTAKGAGAPYKGRSIGKKVEESRGRKGSVHG